MSEFWSGWVMLLIVLNLGITLFLFLWGLRVDIPTQADGTSGHVWAHGVLREGVRRLPTWWVVISVAVFVAGFCYLALYPGFGAFKGVLGWTSHDELARDDAANRQLEAPLLERVRGKPVESIATDTEALRVGEVLFVENCAACHGRDARGNRALGAPDLTDSDWLYGGDGKSILASIVDGRRGVMPGFSGTISEDSIFNIANYVASLAGKPHDSLRAQLGKPLFSTCAACHGVDGKGNPALGAPNLTDDVYLYGAMPRDIAEIIRSGRSGVMPAWRDRLSNEDASLVAAWVYAQSHSVTRR
jgi:cytochrome c oxidase cbb3-type subunit 3